MATTSLPRDPERPKQPLSAYFRFAAAYREKHGVKGGAESVRKIGEAWRNLGAPEKKPFQDVAAAERNIYKRKFEEYKSSGKLDAWKRDPAKPKKPPTAYLSWSIERRKAPDMAKLSVADSAKAMGKEWKALPQASKDVFQARYKSGVEKYETDMKAYKSSGKEQMWLERTGRLAVAKKVEAQKEAAKQKELESKAKLKAAKEKAKLKLKQEKEKMAKAKLAQKKAREKEKLALKQKKEKEAKAVAAQKKSQEKEKLALKRQKAKEAKAKAVQRKAKEVEKLRMKKQKEKDLKAKAALKNKISLPAAKVQKEKGSTSAKMA